MKPTIKHYISADLLTVVKGMCSSFKLATMIPKPSQRPINKEVFEHDGHIIDIYWIDYRQKSLSKKNRIQYYSICMVGNTYSMIFML